MWSFLVAGFVVAVSASQESYFFSVNPVLFDCDVLVIAWWWFWRRLGFRVGNLARTITDDTGATILWVDLAHHLGEAAGQHEPDDGPDAPTVQKLGATIPPAVTRRTRHNPFTCTRFPQESQEGTRTARRYEPVGTKPQVL